MELHNKLNFFDMKDFSKQIEDLCKEITEAIIGLFRRHGLTKLEFPESGIVHGAPDSVYVIFFDDDGDPFECIVTKVSVMGNSLYLTAREKHDGYIFRTESQFDLSVRSPIWLTEILLAAQTLLEPENESDAMATDMNRHIWEGWTVGMFISELAPILEMIMTRQSWQKPFTTKAELAEWCRNNQPYYKKRILAVNNYFAKMYNLK